MKRQHIAIFAGLFLTSTSLPSYATTLTTAYSQALRSDPTFQKARADWETAKADLPITRAAYLTSIAVTGNAKRQYSRSTSNSVLTMKGYNNLYGYALTLTQPIFNMPAWEAIRGANATVKSATATYASAAQNLMQRLSKAYITVLKAQEQLRYTLAQKRAVKQQLEETEAQFKVGVKAATDVYNARSVYDQARSTAIANRNELNDAVELLYEITGIHYRRLEGIKDKVPLVNPVPNDINAWMDVAQQQNYALIAENYAVIAARIAIKQASDGWLPQLNFEASDSTSYVGRLRITPRSSSHAAVYGLSLNFPLLQGGLTMANTQQSRFKYLSACSQREATYRKMMSQTRQSFLGVISGINKIKADTLSVASARKSLEATKMGYTIGTRTMVDILNSITTLYQNQQQLANDQYQYITDMIDLKYNAGILKVDDLKQVSAWMTEDFKLKLSSAALQSRTHRIQLSAVKPPHKAQKLLPPMAVKKPRMTAKVSALPQPRSTTPLVQPASKKTKPVRSVDLPAPKKTRPLAQPTTHRKPLQQQVSLDEQIIPLYDPPSQHVHPLPLPS